MTSTSYPKALLTHGLFSVFEAHPSSHGSGAAGAERLTTDARAPYRRPAKVVDAQGTCAERHRNRGGATVPGCGRQPADHSIGRARRGDMRYILAWIMGVPLSLIVLWFLIGHSACGR